jgi:ribonuclease BN (tRNA processing enzyme)
MIRLTVLGGAAACPNPGQGCSAYLIESDQTALLLDCGPDTLAALQLQRPLDALTAIVISHLHADHILDLIPLRYGLKYMPGLTRRHLPLWLPPGGKAFLHGLSTALAAATEDAEDFFSAVFSLREYNPTQILQCGDLTLTFAPTQHWVPCWAIRITDGQWHIGYTADTGPLPSLVDFFAGVHALICEGTLREQPPDASLQGHLTAHQAGHFARAIGTPTLILTHYWTNLGTERLARDAAAAFGRPVILAQPGLQLTFSA